jgi:competence protein ComEA
MGWWGVDMDLFGGSSQGSAPRHGRRSGAGPRNHGAAALIGPRGVLAGVAVGLLVVGLVVFGLLRGGGPPDDPALAFVEPEASLPGAGGADASGTDADSGRGVELVVHVGGAVVSPGVYTLGPSARIADAVSAAGGALPDADLDRVNLAAPLNDGGQVVVPLRGAAAPSAVGAAGSAQAGVVSLSQADEAALDALPGIGPSTASAIIAHREANGPFSSVEELLEVRGIGEAKLEGLRDLVTP